MKIFRKQEGFTLVELLIAIMTGSIVTLAAATVLLLGLRLNHASSGTATRQNNARILISVLESMAAEGDIQKVDFTAKKEELPDGTVVVKHNDWIVSDADNKPLFSYSQADQTVYTETGGTKTPLVEDVLSSYVDLEGNLLTVSITTADETYMSSIYCRMIPAEVGQEDAGKNEMSGIVGELTDKDEDASGNYDNTADKDALKLDSSVDATADARAAFIKVLLSQYQLKDGRANPGVILEDGYSTGEHYTEWFIYGYNDRNPGWNKETPWCACYVSWCINEIENTWIAEKEKNIPKDYAHWYDNVDVFMEEYFQKGENYGTERKPEWYWRVESYDPIPGDLVFFDWTMDAEKWIMWIGTTESRYAPNPSHVGVVIAVNEETDGKTYVYTIEGNTGGRVAIRKYAIDDPNIIGYGVMPWKTS